LQKQQKDEESNTKEDAKSALNLTTQANNPSSPATTILPGLSLRPSFSFVSLEPSFSDLF